MTLLLQWLVNALALIVVANVLPGFTISSLFTALVLAVVLGVLNVIIRPILLLLTLPINILTLGLFTFIVNALVISLASTIVKGFDITSFGVAVWAAVILWFISWITAVISGGNAKVQS